MLPHAASALQAIAMPFTSLNVPPTPPMQADRAMSRLGSTLVHFLHASYIDLVQRPAPAVAAAEKDLSNGGPLLADSLPALMQLLVSVGSAMSRHAARRHTCSLSRLTGPPSCPHRVGCC